MCFKAPPRRGTVQPRSCTPGHVPKEMKMRGQSEASGAKFTARAGTTVQRRQHAGPSVAAAVPGGHVPCHGGKGECSPDPCHRTVSLGHTLRGVRSHHPHVLCDLISTTLPEGMPADWKRVTGCGVWVGAFFWVEENALELESAGGHTPL